MFDQTVYEKLEIAKELLKLDKVEKCISEMLSIAHALEEDRRDQQKLEQDLTLFSASLARAQDAFYKGMIAYEKNSTERTRVIQGILSNIQGYIQEGRGMFSDPSSPDLLYSVHIEDEELLSQQLLQLAENLEISKSEIG